MTTDELAALAGDSFSQRQARPLLRHCDRCAVCRGLLEEWRSNQQYAHDVRRALQQGRSPASSEVAMDGAFSRRRPIVPLISPDSISGYEVLGEVHRGGQGVVYRAIQQSTKREVAIKLAFDQGQPMGKRPHRFNREVELASRLKHPNIIAIFDSGITPDGRCYFVMDYVHGLPVDQYVRERELGLTETLRLFASICEAVNHAHQRGVIHRDLKPSNILVDAEGVPRLLDFGLAKALGGLDGRLSSVVSATGQLLGTVPYMAPEQLAGRPEAADIRTDVYALGALSYELLAGCLPYDVGLPASELLRRITQGSPTPPSRRWSPVTGIDAHTSPWKRGGCPVDDELDAITLRAMAVSRERRYQSAADLARDVQRYLAGEPIEAKRDRGLYVIRKLLHRYRLFLTIVGTFFVTLAVALTVISVLYLDVSHLRVLSEQQRSLAQSERDRAIQAQKEADDRAEQLRSAMYVNHLAAAVSASTSDNLTRVQEEIYACPADLRGWEWYWLASQFDHSSRVLRGHEQEVLSLGIDPTGPTLLSGGRDATIRHWDLDRSIQIASITAPAEVQGLRFSTDGQRYALWDTNHALTIWETSGRQVSHVQHRGTIRDMCFSPDSRLLAIGNSSGYVDLCDAETGIWLRRLGPHAACAFTVAFSAQGDLIATGSWDETVRIWSVQDGRELHVFREQKQCIPSIAWTPDGTRLISGGCNGSLVVLDPVNGTLDKTLATRGSYVYSVACAPDGRLLATAHQNGTICFWDLQAGMACGRMAVNGTNLRSLIFSPDGRWLIGAGADFTIRIWELSRTPYGIGFEAHEGPSRAVAFGPGGELASAGDDKTVKLWAVLSGQLLRTFRGHEDKVRSVAFSPDGASIASGSMDRTVRLWDVRTGLERKVLRGHEDCVLDVAFSADGRLVASGGSDFLTKGEDNSVRIWNVQTGEQCMCLRGHRAGVPAVAFSPDGTRLASGGRDSTAFVWDLATGRPISTFSQHKATIREITFTPEGESVITSSEDNTIQAWDAESGKLLSPPRSFPKSLLGMALTPDGSRLAACGNWGHVSLFRHDIGWELLRLPTHHTTISSLAFSLDGNSLAASTDNGQLWVWRVVSPQELKRSPQVAEGLATGAMLLSNLGQLEDAQRLFHETMEMHQAIFGPDDRRTLELPQRFYRSLTAHDGVSATTSTARRDEARSSRRIENSEIPNETKPMNSPEQ